MIGERRMPAMLWPYISQELRTNQEFQSGVIRLGIWTFMVIFIGVAGWNDYYRLNWEIYTLLFGIHLVLYLGVLVSVIRRPAPDLVRRYLGMAADLSGVTFAIYLGGEPLTPFYLFYIWIFISQGSRYGKEALKAASIGSIISYSVVVTILDGWERYALDTAFLMLVLVVLPFYQYSLLRQLHQARQAAEAANQARGNFLATMTHELRTPLSGVVGMARLLNTTPLNSEQKEYVNAISTSSSMLQSLIGDILDLSKIDARKLELKYDWFDLRECVVGVANSLGNQALDQGIEIICQTDGAVPEKIWGDELRMRQILYNLVGNAVKFTSEGFVQVMVELAEADEELPEEHLQISVTDTGIGIEQGKLENIFESFWQADSSATRQYGGTGLGTTIARDLTRLMGGKIGVDSVLGKGTTFWVALPLSHLTDGDRQPKAPRPPALLAGRRVLILEINRQSLAVIEAACRQAGMVTIAVSDMDELTRIPRRQAGGLQVDLLVLADSIKGMDLDGVSQMIYKLLGVEVPTLFLSYAWRQAIASPACTRCLVKPFSEPSLWRALAGTDARDETSPYESVLPRVGEGQAAKVLVAEDDAINAKLIQSLLGKAGHEVVLVRDGEQALEAARSEAFDLALVDLRMPRMDGIEFTRQCRLLERGRHLPIVALTANAAEDARNECLEVGMNEFLTKPVDPAVLDRLIRRYMGG